VAPSTPSPPAALIVVVGLVRPIPSSGLPGLDGVAVPTGGILVDWWLVRWLLMFRSFFGGYSARKLEWRGVLRNQAESTISSVTTGATWWRKERKCFFFNATIEGEK
jgi:hypothetical protein